MSTPGRPGVPVGGTVPSMVLVMPCMPGSMGVPMSMMPAVVHAMPMASGVPLVGSVMMGFARMVGVPGVLHACLLV